MNTPTRESDAARAACDDYIAQSPPRSLTRLWRDYRAQTEGRPPTRTLSTLKEWSRAFDWQERAREHDEEVSREDRARVRRERLQEIETRRQQRLQVAGVMRDRIARMLRLLTEEVMEEMEAHELVSAVVRFVQQADTTERLDLGEATVRAGFEILDDDGAPRRILGSEVAALLKSFIALPEGEDMPPPPQIETDEA